MTNNYNFTLRELFTLLCLVVLTFPSDMAMITIVILRAQCSVPQLPGSVPIIQSLIMFVCGSQYSICMFIGETKYHY